MTERDRDALRKKAKRSEASRIHIPDVVDLHRRESCLADPEKFLKTYFANRYRRPFNQVHYEMIDAMIKAAKYGERMAIAAPRGVGKSELCKGLYPYLFLANIVNFIFLGAATTKLAHKLYLDFQKKIAFNDLLYEDFPEVCAPVRALEGAPQRAMRQHVDGKLTHIVWSKTDYICLPEVEGSPYGGKKMAYFGLDSAFRGCNIDGDRPDFVPVDDPETRESAKSSGQISDREEILDRDVAGLVEDGERLGLCVLTTIQNSYCLSAMLTDRKQKSAWGGRRYGIVVTWPDKMELWQEYVSLRHTAQATGDSEGIAATVFYLDNREEMDAGHEMLSDYFVPRYRHIDDFGDEGVPDCLPVKNKQYVQVTFSPLQTAWNKIADTSIDSFKTEYQNDPPKEEEAEKIALTVGRVLKQTSGLEQQEQPDNTFRTVIGLDLGKYKSHWVKSAWDRDCVGSITDYGYEGTHGLSKYSSERAVETALIDMMEQFADSEVCKKHPPKLVLVDSGNFSQACYEACRRIGPPFFPAKGWDSGRFRMPRQTKDDVALFLEAYARVQEDNREKFWLYHVNGEYWKNWLQERFLVDAIVDDARVPGSIGIFEPPYGDRKFHSDFGRHMVSESEELVPVPNRPSKRVWVVHDRRNNHWLDAGALNVCAAACVGVRLERKLIEPKQTKAKQAKQQEPNRSALNRYGQKFFITQR